jgi:hypothetical protein
MSLSLRWEVARTGGHNDLVLRVGEFIHRCDSYYMSLDDSVPRSEPGRTKVAAVLIDLLAQWLRALEGLADGATTYWPFDFSDQCTGWLRVVRSGGHVELLPGWSLLEGYGFWPSSYGSLQPTDWKQMEKVEPLRLTIDACANGVATSILLLRQRHR